jgi:hypothetical protein
MLVKKLNSKKDILFTLDQAIRDCEDLYIQKSMSKVSRFIQETKSKKIMPLQEIRLLLAAREASAENLLFVAKKLTPLSPLPSAATVFLSSDIWLSVFPENDRLALWDPNSELIFIREDVGNLEHIALHEAIHSLQGRGYVPGCQALEEKRVLLEGVTETMTVELDGVDPGFYQEEREAVLSITKKYSIKIKDIALLNPERLYRFILREYFSGNRKKLRAALAVKH